MRDLKFRAWDYTRGKFWYFSVDDTIADIRRVLSLSEWNDLVKQQYTGLKDRNGKEIYEGDIMEYFSGLVPKGTNNIKRVIVRWEEKDACFAGCWSGVVIGNIYENPELLK